MADRGAPDLGLLEFQGGVLGAILSVGSFISTVTIIPFLPDGWDPPPASQR